MTPSTRLSLLSWRLMTIIPSAAKFYLFFGSLSLHMTRTLLQIPPSSIRVKPESAEAPLCQCCLNPSPCVAWAVISTASWLPARCHCASLTFMPLCTGVLSVFQPSQAAKDGQADQPILCNGIAFMDWSRLIIILFHKRWINRTISDKMLAWPYFHLSHVCFL